jgi:predicted GIY-YIG superfamily endonuclease
VKVEQLIPTVEQRVEFSLKSRKFVPASAGCYALSTFDRDVLYVGLTYNLHRRFVQHRDTRKKREPTSVGMAFWFYFLSCDKREVHRIERTWLNEHMELDGEWPLLNKTNSPLL